jgi:hypothetical protein
MMDDLKFRRLKALREVADNPFFGLAVDELRRELADQIADEMDPVKAGALRAERAALNSIRGRIESYLNDLMVVEKKTKSTEQVKHG